MGKQDKQSLSSILKVGIPYTLVGMAVVFAGIYLVRYLFAESRYYMVFIFLWLAVFWFIYQPLFRKALREVAKKTKNSKRGS